ncbi:hypothetical protein DRN86_03515 [Candidatus Geothermarchaeota archaeon]|nr:MAG: hypothetical protein DRN86_03515 [Candidatus Geothermarchaeota archaeon]
MWVQCPYCDYVFKRKGYQRGGKFRLQCPKCGRRFYIWEAKELYLRSDNYFKPVPILKSRSKRAMRIKKYLAWMKQKHKEEVITLG